MTAAISAPETHSAIRRVGRGAASLGVAQVIRRGLRMLTMLVAAKWLGPSPFGIYVLLITMTEMLALISGAAYVDYLTREAVKFPDSAGWIATRLSMIRLLYIAVGTTLIVAGMYYLKYDRLIILYAAVMLLSLVPRTLLECCYGLARGSLQFSRLPILEGVHAGLLFLLSLAMLAKGWGLVSVVSAELGSCLVAAITGMVLTWSCWQKRQHAGWELKTFVGRTSIFNVYPFISNAYDRADVFVLSKLASIAAVGIYGLSYRVFSGIGIIPYSLMGALLPVLSDSSWNSDKEQLCSSIMRILYAVALAAILGVMLFANPVIPLLFGHAYADSAFVLQILIWATIPIYLNYALNTTLLSSGHERIFIITALVCTAFNIGANIVLVPKYSFVAAAAVTIATECVLLAQNLYFVSKKLGRIPMPRRVTGMTLLFGVILGACLVAERAGFPRLPCALVAMLCFVAFLAGDFWTTRHASTASPASVDHVRV